MPRARKAQIAPGETHGERQNLEQLVDSAPVPGADLHAAAVAGAERMPPPPPGGLFGADSTRPQEPITAGLPMGAGPGPEAMPQLTQRANKTQQMLQQAAEMTGNSRLARMAQRSHRPVPRGN